MTIVRDARVELEKLYAAPLQDAEKRQDKQRRLELLRADLDARLALAGLPDSSWPGDELNNARLASLNLYEGGLPAFRTLFRRCNEDFACFYARAEELAGLDKQQRRAALDALAAGEL